MKRGRSTSRAMRAISGCQRDGLISLDDRRWLSSLLAQGDPLVEEALTEAAAGRAARLTELVSAGRNPQLRTRLAKLSQDGTLPTLQIKLSQDGPDADMALVTLCQTLKDLAQAEDCHDYWAQAGLEPPCRRAPEDPLTSVAEAPLTDSPSSSVDQDARSRMNSSTSDVGGFAPAFGTVQWPDPASMTWPANKTLRQSARTPSKHSMHPHPEHSPDEAQSPTQRMRLQARSVEDLAKSLRESSIDATGAPELLPDLTADELVDALMPGAVGNGGELHIIDDYFGNQLTPDHVDPGPANGLANGGGGQHRRPDSTDGMLDLIAQDGSIERSMLDLIAQDEPEEIPVDPRLPLPPPSSFVQGYAAPHAANQAPEDRDSAWATWPAASGPTTAGAAEPAEPECPPAPPHAHPQQRHHHEPTPPNQPHEECQCRNPPQLRFPQFHPGTPDAASATWPRVASTMQGSAGGSSGGGGGGGGSCSGGDGGGGGGSGASGSAFVPATASSSTFSHAHARAQSVNDEAGPGSAGRNSFFFPLLPSFSFPFGFGGSSDKTIHRESAPAVVQHGGTTGSFTTGHNATPSQATPWAPPFVQPRVHQYYQQSSTSNEHSFLMLQRLQALKDQNLINDDDFARSEQLVRLSSSDDFLRGEMQAAMQAAVDRGDTTKLHGMLRMAASLAKAHAAPPLPQHPHLMPGAFPAALMPTFAPGLPAPAVGLSNLDGTIRKVEADVVQLEARVLEKKGQAVTLRNANNMEAALRVMKEVKRIEAIADVNRKQLALLRQHQAQPAKP